MPISEIIQTLADVKIQPKYQEFLLDMRYFCNFFRLSRSASARVRVEVRDGYGRARGVRAAPRKRRSNEAIFDREFQFRESHTEAETKKNS